MPLGGVSLPLLFFVFPPYCETERLGEAPVVGLPPGEIKL